MYTRFFDKYIKWSLARSIYQLGQKIGQHYNDVPKTKPKSDLGHAWSPAGLPRKHPYCQGVYKLGYGEYRDSLVV